MPARKGGHEIFAEIGKTGLTNAALRGIIYLAFAGVAHLVERDLAKVEVASSSLVARSIKSYRYRCVWRKARRINRFRAFSSPDFFF